MELALYFYPQIKMELAENFVPKIKMELVRHFTPEKLNIYGHARKKNRFFLKMDIFNPKMIREIFRIF